MITPSDLPIHESSCSQVALQPVASVIVSCPSISPACLSCIDCLVVPDRGGLGSFDTEVCLFVCLVSRGHAAVCLFAGSIESTNRGGRWGEVIEGEALISGPSSLCVPLLVEKARPPGPLRGLPDKMSGVAPHDLVLLVLWQKTTLKGNSGNHKYLGTKELYGVCCKRIYSGLGGDASVSEGLKQCLQHCMWILPQLSAKPGELNQISTSALGMQTSQLFQTGFRKTGVSLASSWFRNCNRLQNDSQTRQVGGLIWTDLEMMVLGHVRIWYNDTLSYTETNN